MKRRGISIIELATCIAIIVVLLALLLPAVQSSREASRGLGCSSNLRQLALGVHNFEAAHGVFPPDANEDGNLQVLLLPYIDGTPRVIGTVYFDPLIGREARTYPPPPAILHCPSDPSAAGAALDTKEGATSYLGNAGTGFRWYGYNGIFSPWLDSAARTHSPNLSGPTLGKVLTTDVRDGLSNTAEFAEILVGDGTRHLRRVHWQLRGNYQEPNDFETFASVCLNHAFRLDQHGKPVGTTWKGRPWWEPGHGRSLYNHIIAPNQPSCIGLNGSVLSGTYTPGSLHPRGVNVAFADGHLQCVANSIAIDVWRAIGSRNGHESIAEVP